MTQNTPIYGLPYPEFSDAPDGPTQIHALALAVETVLARTDGKSKLIVFTASGSLLASQVVGAKSLKVICKGGGGAGGGCALTGAAQVAGGSGGGEGATAVSILDVSAVAFPVTVTVPGAAVGASGASGAAGGDVSFAALVIAKGGSGGGPSGAVAGATIGYLGPGGAAGGTAAASTGQFTASGAAGGSCLSMGVSAGALNVASGGGSGSAFPLNYNSTPSAVTVPGAGGHGAANLQSQGTAKTGGTAGAGYCLVEVIY